MQKKLALIFLLAIAFLDGYGQKINGLVRDSATLEPLPFATISAIAANGKVISGSLSDDGGRFTFTLPKETAAVEIGFMGYNTQRLDPPFGNIRELQIDLAVQSTLLNDIVVEGERTTREFLIDRKVIHFGSELQASGGTVLEAFGQLPELEVNPSTGDLFLRGNSNVRILVNGKPSPLNNQDLLEQINASEVEKVEIITSPSARYQADGLAGIINIVLDHKVVKGLAGTLNLNARTNPGHGASFNLKSGFGRFNVQGTVSHRDNFYKGRNTNIRSFNGTNEGQISNANNEFDGQVNSLNLQTDWFINDNNDLSASVRLVNNEHDIDVTTNILDQSTLTSTNSFLNNFHSHKTAVYHLNYRSRFNKEGDQYLDLDINLNRNDNILPYTLHENGRLIWDDDLFYDNQILNMAIDFVTPVGKHTKLETGALYTFKSIDNVQTPVAGGQENSSSYIYDEKTYAGYAIIKKQLSDLGVQLGIRAEHFNSDGVINHEANAIGRNFFNLFPSIHIRYKVNDRLNYSLAYNRRIARPSFHNINPLTTINDPQYRREGNPGLNPEFTDNVEASVQYNTKKISVDGNVFYRYTTDMINRTFAVDNDQITVMTYENGGKSHAFGLESTITKEVSEKLSLSLTSTLFYQQVQAALDDFFFRDLYNYTFRSNLKYSFSKNLSADVQFLYFGKRRRLNAEVEDRNFMNVALRYRVLKGKGSMNLRFTDVYRGDIYKNSRFSNDIDEDMKWVGQTRVAIFSFVYNFSKGDIKSRKSRGKNYRESGALE